MRVGRFLLAAAAVLLLGAAATLALFTLDLGGLSRPLVRWASERLQRPLHIDGRVSLHAGRTLRLTAEGVRLANAEWGSRSEMLVISRMVVEVDALSLLRRPVIVRRIEIDGFDLLLERQGDGANNWDFGSEATQDSSWPTRLPVVVERVSLPGARIRFKGPRLDRPLDVRFERLEQQRSAGGMLELAGQGLANEERIGFTAQVGPFAGLVAGRQFGVVADGRFGDLDLDMDLRVDDLARPVNTQLDLKIRGPGAEYLGTRFGVRNLGTGPLDLDASIRPSADGAGVVAELTGQLGQFSIKAHTELADPAEMRKLRATLQVAGPDLGFAGGLAGVDRLPAEPFRLAIDVDRAGDTFNISEAVLETADSRVDLSGTISQFRTLAGNDLRFSFKGAELARFHDLLDLPAGLDGAFDIAGTLRASGDAELIDIQATTTRGTLEVTGPLGARPDYYGTRLRFAASGPSLVRVGALAAVGGLPDVDFRGTGEFEWTKKGAVIRQGRLQAGTDQLGIDGLVARQPLDPGTDLKWSIAGPNLRKLADGFDIAGLPAGPFELRGRLRRETRGSRLDDVRGTMAGAEVRVSGRIADQPLRGTSVAVSVDGPRLEAFAGLLPDYRLPSGKFRVAGALALTPERVKLTGMRVAAAGAQGTVDADIELPLSAVRGEFRVAATGRDVTPFLPRLGSVRPAMMPFDLQAHGEAQGGAWRLDQAEFKTEAFRISGSGRLDWAPDFSATALKVTASAPDLAAAGRVFALSLPAQPFNLTAEFSGTPTAFKVERASGRLGGTDFEGRLGLDLGGRTMLDVDFRSALLDLTPFTPKPAEAGPVLAPASSGPGRRRTDPRLIPDALIPLDWLDRLDGLLAVRADRALVAHVALDDLRMIAGLKNGRLTLDSLELKAAPDGGLRARGSLERGARGAALQVAATGTRLSLARLDDTPAVRAARPRAEINFDFTGEGATWRELARSLDGRFRLTTGPGSIPVGSMSPLMGGFWVKLVTAVAPKVGVRDTANVRCLAAFFDAADGVLRTTPALVMQTDKVNVVAHGAVYLATEDLEFYLNTAPRRGRVDVTVGEIVNPYMKVTGPLSDPGLGVDPKGVLFSGGAAVATAGISIIAKGVWDRMFRAEDPCAVAGAEAARLDAGGPAVRRRLIPWPGRGR
jgi:uncharacterized protein involved in outer membrane biogenesis